MPEQSRENMRSRQESAHQDVAEVRSRIGGNAINMATDASEVGRVLEHESTTPTLRLEHVMTALREHGTRRDASPKQ